MQIVKVLRWGPTVLVYFLYPDLGAIFHRSCGHEVYGRADRRGD